MCGRRGVCEALQGRPGWGERGRGSSHAATNRQPLSCYPIFIIHYPRFLPVALLFYNPYLPSIFASPLPSRSCSPRCSPRCSSRRAASPPCAPCSATCTCGIPQRMRCWHSSMCWPHCACSRRRNRSSRRRPEAAAAWVMRKVVAAPPGGPRVRGAGFGGREAEAAGGARR